MAREIAGLRKSLTSACWSLLDEEPLSRNMMRLARSIITRWPQLSPTSSPTSARPYSPEKPSLIVTYSAGQWGGARAAVAMRPFLSELGCLPGSAMVHVPEAHTVFVYYGD
jgi:hypothetical protein